MPNVIHCHTGRRLFAVVTAWLIAIATFMLAGCVVDDERATLTSHARPATPYVVGGVDPDYFPSQFPAPTGDIEPLPPQF